MSRELDALRDLVTCPVCGDQDLGHAQRACMKNEIARLRATIFRLKNELREIDIAIDDPESNLTKTQAECVLKMHRTITHLRSELAACKQDAKHRITRLRDALANLHGNCYVADAPTEMIAAEEALAAEALDAARNGEGE